MKRFFGLGTAAESPHEASSPPPLPAASPNMSAGPARPIRLVYTDEKGRFHMDPEAVALLQLVKQPVGVVSVCGRARQGKSFILNQVQFVGMLCISVGLFNFTAICCVGFKQYWKTG